MAQLKGKNEGIADDVYVQFVASLFANAHILIVGGVSYCIVAIVTYAQTGFATFLAFAPLLLAANLWRYLGIRAFHANGGRLRDVEHAREWEQDYIIRGCWQGLAVGAFSFASIYVHPNPYAEVASLSMAVASLITVATRNYGSPRMVRILSVTFIGPAAIAFLLRGDLAYAILGLMIVPTMIITVGSADYVRQVLFSAIVGQKTSRLLAQRFDRALNTMPQGLLMFNSTGKVIVANAEAAHLIGMGSVEAMTGRSIEALMGRIVAAGLLDRERCRYTTQQLMDALHQGFDRKLIIALADGRSFEFSTREGDNDLGVVIFEDVTQRVRAAQRISTMARFDSLTELPNRGYFHELLVERLAGGNRDRNCALAILDLDDFKAFNDSLGHPAGDQLIRAVGQRLSPFASDDVVVGRLGGDEFVVFCDNVEDRDALGRFINALRVRLGEDVDVYGSRLRLQVSGGAVMVKAQDADVDAMTVRADLALQEAKANGKDGWALFEEAMEHSFRLRQMMKADLRAAIKSRGLRVVYQPIVAIGSLKIASCEALCRWDHPELGQISPAVFIPLAEEMGIISEITAFVLEKACTDCAKWPEPIGVSVNLSAKDFVESVVETVSEVLRSTGLAPERLEIEMTETSLLNDKSSARRYVEELRRIGVRIALDDFGTGYSSLSYLHRLMLDKIKIDRSFLLDVLEDSRSLQLLKSIVQMSHRLDMAVTVEGVETFDQLKLLAAEVKPDLVQGFLFGAALTASGIETMSTTAWPFADHATIKGKRPPRKFSVVSN